MSRCEVCECHHGQNGGVNDWLIHTDRMRLCPVHAQPHVKDFLLLAAFSPPVVILPPAEPPAAVASTAVPFKLHLVKG